MSTNAAAGSRRGTTAPRNCVPSPPDDPRVLATVAAGGFYDEATGHTVSGAFVAWYVAHEGDYYLGSPLSEVVVEDGMPAQRFEGGDVPYVMYVNLDAEALHGAYWHENFGQRMSHGCINLPVPVAEFLYGWVPLGTPVTVY